MKVLHILNGDATRQQFDKTEIEGTVAVWREMLSDGPGPSAFEAAAFWENRLPFLREVFQISPSRYHRDFMSQLSTITAFRQYDEVVLWFEFDLFCQLNLMALIAFLEEQQDYAGLVSLVCVGEQTGSRKLLGLGEIEPASYPELFNNRRELSKRELAYAGRVWRAYCADHPTELQQCLSSVPEGFPYLTPALRSHFRRFPSPFNGLNAIEEQLLHQVSTGGKTKKQVVGAMLRWQVWYGFGDLQYFVYLKGLEPLFREVGGELHLTEQGERVLDGDLDYLSLPQRPYFFGGVKKQSFRYEPEKQNFIKN